MVCLTCALNKIPLNHNVELSDQEGDEEEDEGEEGH